mgnify:CR=1 FL=1
MGTDETHRTDWAGLAIGLGAPMAWGMAGIFIRLVEDLPGTLIVATRLFVAFALFAPALLIRRRHLADALRTPLPLAMAAYYMLATAAFLRAPIVNVMLIVGLSPAIALLIDRLRGISASRVQVAGAAVALAGLAVFLGPQEMAPGAWRGAVLALGAALASALYATGLRGHHAAGRRTDPAVLTGLACLYGGVLALAAFFILGGSMPATVTAGHAGWLFLLGAVSTAIPTLAFGIASSRLPAVMTTGLMLLSPVFAGLFGGIWLGEWPAPIALPGAAIVIFGLFLTTRSARRPAQ